MLEATHKQALRVKAFILSDAVQTFQRRVERAGQDRGQQQGQIGQAQVKIEQMPMTGGPVGEGT